MKRKYTFFLFFCFLVINLSAQNFSKNAYLLSTFMNGKVVHKDGATSKALFNYNLVNKKILFKGENNEILELSNPNELSYINIGEMTFEHVSGQKFYEKISINDLDLYVYWQVQLLPEGKTGAYGVRDQTSSVHQLQTVYSYLSKTNTISTEDDFLAYSKNQYFLKINDKFKLFDSSKSLSKLFKGKEFEVERKLTEDKLNFENFEDVKKAIAICSQFVK